MTISPADLIGAAWFEQAYGIAPIAGLPVVSAIGGRRSTYATDLVRRETYVEAMRPDPTPAAHLQFHLRHEGPHLEFLARLFAHTGPSMVQDWVNREPTGKYARQAAFLYEWLTDDALTVPDRLAGNYVDAIDSDRFLTAAPDRIIKTPRWRINDNLPGSRFFCPLLPKTTAIIAAGELDVRGLLADLMAEFGEDLLMRAATWITLRESKASFAI